MNIPGGHVDFLPDSPWTPLLDVRGTARISGVDVQAYAFGPLNEKKLILRSEPPLSQGSLVRLLSGGLAAGGRTSADPGAHFPAISLAGKPDWRSTYAGGIMSLLPLHPIPALPLWDRATLPRKFQLVDSLDLVPEREGGNRSFNSATTYTWRFR